MGVGAMSRSFSTSFPVVPLHHATDVGSPTLLGPDAVESPESVGARHGPDVGNESHGDEVAAQSLSSSRPYERRNRSAEEATLVRSCSSRASSFLYRTMSRTDR